MTLFNFDITVYIYLLSNISKLIPCLNFGSSVYIAQLLHKLECLHLVTVAVFIMSVSDTSTNCSLGRFCIELPSGTFNLFSMAPILSQLLYFIVLLPFRAVTQVFFIHACDPYLEYIMVYCATFQ